ncbi:MAG: hypothetical protein HY825_16095 [Acidobacteria bacterium]|nr:hypothetical protein [Acidobacteriota bacterium]
MTDVGSTAARAFRLWACREQLRLDARLLVHEERGRDGDDAWAIRWSRPDGVPLRRWRDGLIGHRVLGIAVETSGSHVEGHVAAHAVTDDGTVRIAALWDFEQDRRRVLRWRWADLASRSLSRCWRTRFPSAAVLAAIKWTTNCCLTTTPRTRKCEAAAS